MDAQRYKAPRTRHLPSSQSKTEDDKIATVEQITEAFEGQRVIITEKMDGENTTIYSDGHSHARSIDSKFHPSRSIVRELAGRVAHDLPQDYRVCGENIFAVHSIEYSSLPTHFQVFGIWHDDTCLSWDEMLDWCGMLDLLPVPVVYDGVWQGEAHAHGMWHEFKSTLPAGQESEGFVVRRADAITYDGFKYHVAKWVRPRHVTTSEHWLHQEMRVNGLMA